MAVYRNLVVDIPKEHVTIERQGGSKPALVKYVLEAPYDREKGYVPIPLGTGGQRACQAGCEKNGRFYCLPGY